jgi:hypothetical protein
LPYPRQSASGPGCAGAYVAAQGRISYYRATVSQQERAMSSNVLRGNFEPKKQVVTTDKEETLEDRFEMEAKKRLGGSIAYVKKKSVMWDADKK